MQRKHKDMPNRSSALITLEQKFKHSSSMFVDILSFLIPSSLSANGVSKS